MYYFFVMIPVEVTLFAFYVNIVTVPYISIKAVIPSLTHTCSIFTFSVVHVWSCSDKHPGQSNQQSHDQVHHNPGLKNLMF